MSLKISLPMVYVKGALKRLDMLRNTNQNLRLSVGECRCVTNGLKEKGFDIGTT